MLAKNFTFLLSEKSLTLTKKDVQIKQARQDQCICLVQFKKRIMEGHDKADGGKMGGRDKWRDRTKETVGEKRRWN